MTRRCPHGFALFCFECQLESFVTGGKPPFTDPPFTDRDDGPPPSIDGPDNGL